MARFPTLGVGFFIRSVSLIALAIGLVVLPTPAHAAFPGANGKIVFSRSLSSGDNNLYTINSDGTSLNRINNGSCLSKPTWQFECSPAWSADGSRIAYSRVTEDIPDGEDFCCHDIFVINADGTGLTQLTHNDAQFGPRHQDENPSGSPDGSKIVFGRYNGNSPEVSGIYVMKADGTNVTRLTPPPVAGEFVRADPAWSPDGSKIAFECGGICVMDTDGSGETNLTPGTTVLRNPSWSPDGSRIAFRNTLTDCSTGPCYAVPGDIYVMNADGTGRTNITNNPARERNPAWSPDGTKIAFTRECGSGCAQIYVMDIDGSSQTPITDAAAVNSNPDWQPIQRPHTAPVGASPLRVSLVPAYKPCETADADSRHGAPLDFLSCSSPQFTTTTSKMTFNSIGFFRAVVCPVATTSSFCNPTPAGTMPLPDVRFTGSIREVLCAAGGTPGCPAAEADYNPSGNTMSPYTNGGSGTAPPTPFCNPDATSQTDCVSGTDVTIVPMIAGRSGGARLTSEFNCDTTGSGPTCPATTTSNWPATTEDFAMFPIGIPLDCTEGAIVTTWACGVNTTANALVPGSVIAGQAEVIQIGEVRVLDSGPNGVRGDSDDELFATQGVFLP